MSSYKVELDITKCVACGTCYSGDSVHFEPDGAGYARVVGGDTDGTHSSRVFTDANMEQAIAAAGYCPVSAISVTRIGPSGKC